MRQGHDNGVLTNTAGEFIGIALGADYCAEHECGIRGLQRDFGIPGPTKEKPGIEARRITTTGAPMGLALLALPNPDKKKRARKDRDVALLYNPGLDVAEQQAFAGRQPRWPGQPMATFWDEGSFLIRVEAELTPQLVELRDAFEAKDVSIFLSGRAAFDKGGLVVIITSKTPEAQAKIMAASDLSTISIKERAEATGIEKKLEAAGKRWFALRPGCLLVSRRDGELVQTKYDVMFWLNPMDQHINNYGWFTVEELEQWAENRGPVVSPPPQRG